MLKAENLSFAYRDIPLFEGLNFSASPGEITAILGPNGSGKTTLLKLLVGEERAVGTVTLNGLKVDASNAKALAQVRGVLAQSAQLAFPFKVLEVLRIGLLAGPYATNESIMLRALDAVGLAGFADRFYHELSGGEQQRTQLARVLCQVWEPIHNDSPCWLFLDEPVSSLDIAHQIGIMDMARTYADTGGGVVAVMHDLNLTARYADKVALMKAGVIKSQGTPDTVFSDQALSEIYNYPLQVIRPADHNSAYVIPNLG